MSHTATQLVVVGLLTSVLGYLAGSRKHPDRAPSSTEPPAPAETASDAAFPAPPSSGDYQTLKNKLALCMAFHPPESEQDKQLAICRNDLAVYRGPRPTLPDCYDFIDFVPTYDRELGELDPSPETLERARSLTAAECVPVLTWAERAGRQRRSCLSGEAPPGFKERYGHPIGERPFVKACNAEALKTEAMNAWLRREEDRVREMGHDVKTQLRRLPDGSYRASTPSAPRPEE